MRYESITYPDVNNGIGCRVTLWVSGCSHHCKGCQNKQTWDFNSGNVFDGAAKQKVIELLNLPYIKGLTLSGGDPLCSYADVLCLTKEIKDVLPNKDIWLYTGFTLQSFHTNGFDEILKYVDFIVDGEYIEALRDVSLPFRGSSNQKVYKRGSDGAFNEYKF